MIQQVSSENPEKNSRFENRATAGSENGPIDAYLQAVIERWTELSNAVKAGIMAMVPAAGG